MAKAQVADPKLARRLILDELFDLSLYKALREVAAGDQRRMLEELIPVETRHFAFWQDFFDLRLPALDVGRRIKLALIVALCRVLGAPVIHLALEAIEVYGVRKYLDVWETYRDSPLGPAVREVLEDEFRHEDAVVTGDAARTLNPERIRNIFLGLNDGLVEILGAVSGFFGAFGDAVTVLIAGSTVAVAGALSMAAGAYVAASSESEVRKMESARERFLGQAPRGTEDDEPPLRSALIVGASYFAGALVPVLPVLFGATSALLSLLAAGTMIIVVSMLLAFLSGMDVKRRVAVNVVIIAAAVVVTYVIGTATRALWGISL
ncbi:MAG TPA: VIT1/CCC1 transporter family protein [Methylomirabilota bacterium]|nr:VIT1/CCC1 transporter family protein [Methylomirabilota bacterium]